MASCLPSSYASLIKPSLKQAFRLDLKVQARSKRYGVKASNMVDADMRVLRLRIKEIRRKERIERCCRCKHGWNYEPSGFNSKIVKKEKDLLGYFELAGLIGVTFGITCLTGAIFLSLVSLVVHLNLYQ
ncbi:uncharacterized protein LOC110608596 [Manihot esculenta]|uniref:Uncharacterized protein n=1 Tax=Manihot esculenta TaxID=3983 RepID=A0A2C9WBR3_MANES|nr:uncharacterized protein LOC110608596 [Manihot esculenta]OAY57130.1 hypothetical protein MANES_02G073100v8 [Manihot esculenta]